MNVRKLFRLLNPKVASYVPRVDNMGEAAITRDEFVAALAAMDEAAALMCRVKYGGQVQYLAMLQTFIRGRVMAIAIYRSWDRRAGRPFQYETLEKMADACLDEYLNHTCKSCGGAGVMYSREGVRTDCVSCHGEPQDAARKPGARARSMDISRQAFYETWDKRYELVMDDLKDFERRNLALLRAKLY